MEIADIAPLRKMRIRTDGKGTRPHWFLERVMHFHCVSIATCLCENLSAYKKEEKGSELFGFNYFLSLPFWFPRVYWFGLFSFGFFCSLVLGGLFVGGLV